jgi:hypothetical protein
MDGPEWLRSQLTSFTCPACRRHYQAGSIRLLAERDGLFFVDLDCAVCNSHTVAIVTIGSDDAESAIAEVPRTLSGKVLEVPVKRILMGTDPDRAASRDSLANPDSLDYFIELSSKVAPAS